MTTVKGKENMKDIPCSTVFIIYEKDLIDPEQGLRLADSSGKLLSYKQEEEAVKVAERLASTTGLDLGVTKQLVMLIETESI
jgi:hypothetical protein